MSHLGGGHAGGGDGAEPEKHTGLVIVWEGDENQEWLLGTLGQGSNWQRSQQGPRQQQLGECQWQGGPVRWAAISAHPPSFETHDWPSSSLLQLMLACSQQANSLQRPCGTDLISQRQLCSLAVVHTFSVTCCGERRREGEGTPTNPNGHVSRLSHALTRGP